MAKQMKSLGMTMPLMGGETMNTEKFLQLAGDAGDGSYASTPGAALEKQPTARPSPRSTRSASSRTSPSTRPTSTTA